MIKFSSTLDVSHLVQARELKKTLLAQGVAAGEQRLMATTSDLFRQGFKRFPEIATNEFAQD